MISRGLFIASSPNYCFENPPDWYMKRFGTVDTVPGLAFGPENTPPPFLWQPLPPLNICAFPHTFGKPFLLYDFATDPI
jgi:hypothetical protein